MISFGGCHQGRWGRSRIGLLSVALIAPAERAISRGAGCVYGPEGSACGREAGGRMAVWLLRLQTPRALR